MSQNADVTKRATVHAGRKEWTASKLRGINRIMFDLVDNVKDVSTALVKYDPESRQPARVHAGGEEFLVLQGVVTDESGDYPEGSYVRKPPGTRFSMWSRDGSMLFKKKWQFASHDRTSVNIDAFSQPLKRFRHRPGVTVQRLYADSREDVRIEYWDPNRRIELMQCNGLEVFLLEGAFTETATSYRRYSWLRLPPGESLRVNSGEQGARLLVKEGHLVHSVPGRPALAM